ncbi:glutathione S-transferase family protein [Ramlibacter sp. AW1]|uniref:Glutathione S-transferase family protein n=1 Tax=Ramlibacter aurantiacus TaxID=2801330 RepID=A0A936ZSP8_9BURK|nr:glutathione S-transferase family protein [Ramlibacter aurantiacus]MBL0422763.1 glutathione S-transferase family protein [Ramlibacter aurantiacus]
MDTTAEFTVYHIPVCPFSQRLEILLALKEARSKVRFEVVDITQPRPPELLAKSRGSTALPIMELPGGRILKESLVLMQFIEDLWPDPAVAQRDPYRRAVENMLVRLEGDFANAGYAFVMNQDPQRREPLRQRMLEQFARIDEFLVAQAPRTTYLFENFGWAEAVFTPLFMRFWFLEYYEEFDLPADARFDRVRDWREACLRHPAAQQVSREEIIKLYYDYAKGAGNGALLPGRERSSFVFEPHWSDRPWPPRDKWSRSASDAELGLSLSD